MPVNVTKRSYMKTRLGFVSNSSSSSFVVIGNSSLVIPKFETEEYCFGQKGETEFGWGPDDIYDFYSRVNFAYLQCVKNCHSKWCCDDEPEISHQDWHDMLINVLKENTGLKEITFDVEGYIDHQSSAAEDRNTEIFDDKETLAQFLFDGDSYIHLDNDNH